MAKRKKTNTTKNYNKSRSRVIPRNTNNSLRFSKLARAIINQNNRFIEDRRRYNPTRQPRTHKTTLGTSAKIIFTQQTGKKNQMKFKTPIARFVNPAQVIACVRRKQRKEIMFANKKAGRQGQRKQKRNSISNIKC